MRRRARRRAMRAAMRSKITRARNSVVVLRPAKSGSSSRLRKFSSASTARSTLGGQPDVDHDAVGIELGAAQLDVDHVGRAVQALRRAEDLAAEAVGDHEVVADVDAVHGGVFR